MATLSGREPALARRRLAVVGTSGSGKSTLAKRLAAALGGAHVELDRLYWRPGWQPAEPEEFEAAVREALRPEVWVCDGNFPAVRALVFGRATDLVWLRRPLPVVMARLLWRSLRRGVLRKEIHGGNRESLRQSFLSRDSVLLWALQTHSGYERTYRALPGPDFPDLVVHELRTDRDVEAFARGVEAWVARPSTEGSLPFGRRSPSAKNPS